MNDRNVGFFDLEFALAGSRERLDAAWRRVMEHRQFVGGPEVEEFENAFSKFCDAPHCVGVGNGTDAIELTLLALGIEAGSEVIIPANTFVATAAAVSNIGAVPRFVDVDPDTLLLTAQGAQAAINSRTSAIIAVHLFGQPCEIDELAAVAASAGVVLIEDAAQAHGAEYKGQRIGSRSAAATFSFYPGKNLGALGDGGAVVTTDPALAERIRSLSAHGRSPEDRYEHLSIGRNSRLDTLQAAMLLVRLDSLDDENRRRRQAFAWYQEMLPATARLVTQRPNALSAHHLIVARVDDRAALRAALAQRGVGTGIHYPVPCHLQPAFAALPAVQLPAAELAASQIMSLPLWSHIERDDVEYVCDQIRQLTSSDA